VALLTENPEFNEVAVFDAGPTAEDAAGVNTVLAKLGKRPSDRGLHALALAEEKPNP
jgi:hypothetical protein